MTEIAWDPQALEFLDKLPAKDRQQILQRLDKDVRHNPLRFIEHLAGTKIGKIRIGQYRLFVTTFAIPKSSSFVRFARGAIPKSRGRNAKRRLTKRASIASEQARTTPVEDYVDLDVAFDIAVKNKRAHPIHEGARGGS